MSEHTENTAAALRAHLFDTIRAVKDGKMDADRANAISNAAGTIVKIELCALKHADTLGGKLESEFMKSERPKLVQQSGPKPVLGYSRG